MKEFEPSPDFVARVMASVRAEAHTCAVATRWSTARCPLRCAGGLRLQAALWPLGTCSVYWHLSFPLRFAGRLIFSL